MICESSARVTRPVSLAGALICAGLLSAVPAQAGRVAFGVVHAFAGREGGLASGQVLRGSDGNFYATSPSGGSAFDGALLKITPSGATKILHEFTGADGQYPVAGLVEGPDGKLYGSASGGGASGAGTLFRISPDGQFELLHELAPDEGAGPESELVLAPDGNFYGTTVAGGKGFVGTIVRMTLDGHVRKIFDFADAATLSEPVGMTVTPDGDLVGVALQSASVAGCSSSCGGIFRLSTDGNMFRARVLRDKEGTFPIGAPMIGSDGNVYGTAELGGNDGACCGTLWRYRPDGRFEVIHRFHGNGGANPRGRLLQASDGNLYGTAAGGGALNECGGGCGSLFRMTPDGTYQTLYRLSLSDGAFPFSGLVESTDGSLYGLTTLGGGRDSDGTLFRISRH
jgi:uncharacterized repeat protein (TIGR03803 family)